MKSNTAVQLSGILKCFNDQWTFKKNNLWIWMCFCQFPMERCFQGDSGGCSSSPSHISKIIWTTRGSPGECVICWCVCFCQRNPSSPHRSVSTGLPVSLFCPQKIYLLMYFSEPRSTSKCIWRGNLAEVSLHCLICIYLWARHQGNARTPHPVEERLRNEGSNQQFCI